MLFAQIKTRLLDGKFCQKINIVLSTKQWLKSSFLNMILQISQLLVSGHNGSMFPLHESLASCVFSRFRNKKNEKQHGRKKKVDEESSVEMLDAIISDADTVRFIIYIQTQNMLACLQPGKFPPSKFQAASRLKICLHIFYSYNELDNIYESARSQRLLRHSLNKYILQV